MFASLRAAAAAILSLACVAVPAANLLSNPDFASGEAPWLVENGNASSFGGWTDEIGHDAPGALSIYTGFPGDSVAAFQCVPIAAQSVELYAHAIIESGGGDENYGIVAISSFTAPDCAGYISNSYKVARPEVLPGEWVIHRLQNHPLPAGTQSVMVFLRLTVQQTSIRVAFDDAGFGPTGTAGMLPPSPNLLLNPEFERTLFNWDKPPIGSSSWVTLEDEVGYPSPGSVLLYSGLQQPSAVSQCVQLPGGAFEAYAYSQGDPVDTGGQLSITFFSAADCVGHIGQHIAARAPGPDGWTLHHALDATAPAGAISARVALEVADPVQEYVAIMDHAAFGAAGTVGAPTQYFVAGTVSGLLSAGLSLRLNDGAPLAIAGDGAFVFPERLFDGNSYAVTIASAPSHPSQTCSVVAGSGTIDGADVDDVEVTCQAPPARRIGGSVSGLVGSGLSLRLNDGAPLAITGNGGFTFSDTVQQGLDYSVTIQTQPGGPAQSCSVANGSGTAGGADVDNVMVTCASPAMYRVGGTVEGLVGSGLALQLNGGVPLAIGGNGAFQFPTTLVDGSSYVVTIATAPSAPAQTCNLEHASGTIDGADADDIVVRCLAPDTLPGPIFRDGFE